MCLDEGKLMAYLDGEVSAEERTTIDTHLDNCAECASRLAALEADSAFAARTLDSLTPSAEVLPLPPLVRPAPRRWTGIAAGVAAVLVAASFAFAPVRVAAADLLRVFRVQKVQTIALSPSDLQQMQDTLKSGSGHIDMKSLGEAWVDGGPREPKDVTLTQAQAAVDFPVQLPKGIGEPKLSLQGAQTVKFKLNVDAVNGALRYYGSDRMLPDSVDGKVFEVRIPVSLTARYGDAVGKTAVGPQNGKSFTDGVFVGQARSPELIVPEGVDPAQLRDVLLNLPFLPKNVRDQLAAVDDWHATLLVPSVGGTAKDVTIDGVPAVVMTPDSLARTARAKASVVGTGISPLPEHVTTVLWNKDGVIRAISGSVDETKAMALARSCME